MTGRLTLPTDADVIDETLRLKNLLGADALRDCDGTEMPEELLSEPVKKYATYYTTRKDNEWASANPEEIQQEYLISNRVTARGETLRIRLMEGFHTEQLKVNTLDDPKRWWEVIDRTTGEIVPTDKWEFDEATGEVEIQTKAYHEYTVSFQLFLYILLCLRLSYIICQLMWCILPIICNEVIHMYRIPDKECQKAEKMV